MLSVQAYDFRQPVNKGQDTIASSYATTDRRNTVA